MIFRGLYEPITVARHSSHSLLICIVVALACWTDGTANVPGIRVFGEFTFSFLCSFACAASSSLFSERANVRLTLYDYPIRKL